LASRRRILPAAFLIFLVHLVGDAGVNIYDTRFLSTKRVLSLIINARRNVVEGATSPTINFALQGFAPSFMKEKLKLLDADSFFLEEKIKYRWLRKLKQRSLRA
jgi:hypothetical protein